MKSYFGTYYPASVSAGIECTILVFDRNLSIGFKDSGGRNVMVNWPLREVSASYEFGRQSSKLQHSGSHGHLLVEGKEASVFVKDMQAERNKPWYKKSSGKEWIRNSLLFVGILGVLVLLYFLLVPWLSEKLASKVSRKTEQQLGAAVYNALGLSGKEDTAASAVLNEFFEEMNVPSAYPIQVTVINDEVVNAFAVPGGRIVVYSALLEKISTYSELAALLSHEFIHIEKRHSTKSLFRRLGSKVFLGLLFGKFGAVTSILVDHADNLKSLTYSRRLEKQADMDGLAILRARKIDPLGFVDLFETLQAEATSSVLPEFLASHPNISRRIDYIKEASKDAIVADNPRLKAIFEKLK
jgi:beta-barrel assembly-enhancing protease